MTRSMLRPLAAAMTMLTTASCATQPAASAKPTDPAYYSEADVDWLYDVRTHPGAACTMPDSVWDASVVIANRMLKFDASNRRAEGKAPR
jgi:hypothetical protein